MKLMLLGQRSLSILPSLLRNSAASLHTLLDEIQIEKLLVANRGEIACRIFTTAKRLGIPCVAVYSSADRLARHVSLANEAAWIGPPPAAESYLNREKILEVARTHKIAAIHPGYGFLSEDFIFAEQSLKEGFVFVGPSASAIRAMGDKSEAKRIMRQAGVPVVPGYDDSNQDLDYLLKQGDQTGYPLLVKANMGGGGKGMKLARNKDELREGILSAQREALASFGDSRVLLERFIERPRHVEVQILGDAHGTVIHLFERDCSIQRRHQKVIEESPAPNVSEEFRQSICSAAVEAAKAVNYQNAGTVEFILDTDTNEFYFMEMNTRLQVEHPVTEWISGLDLVELQLLVASGKPLPFAQEDIIPRGHSIEARLYAELPHQGFRPGTGTLQKWGLPSTAVEFCLPPSVRGVRVDSGVREGDSIGVFYDPMIAKIIAGGKDREEARSQLSDALNKIQVGGLSTNYEFLFKIINHPKFKEMDLNTSFISQYQTDLLTSPDISPDLLALTCAVQCLLDQQTNSRMDPLSPWGRLGNKRLNHDHVQTFRLQSIEGKDYILEVISSLDDTITLKEKSSPIKTTISRLSIENGRFHGEVNLSLFGLLDFVCLLLKVNGDSISGDCLLCKRTQDYEISTWSSKGQCTLYWKKQETKSLSSENLLSEEGSGLIVSPMPGRITKIMVKKGDDVEEGEAVILMEAMKMEHSIKAPFNGKVFSVMVHTGSQVTEGKSLIEIKATPSNLNN